VIDKRLRLYVAIIRLVLSMAAIDAALSVFKEGGFLLLYITGAGKYSIDAMLGL
jgi:hypothetical protein